MNDAYRMVDTIFEYGPFKLNVIVNLIHVLPETDTYDERIVHYWSEYKIEKRPSTANKLIKRKIDYYLTLEFKDYNKGEGSIFIPNDCMGRFTDSIDYAFERAFGRTQTIFIKENGRLGMTSLLPVVSDVYPKNKIFKILPTIINSKEYQQAGATIVVGNEDCRADITDTMFGYLTRMLRTLNLPTYVSTMLAALPPPSVPITNQMVREERKPAERMPRGRMFDGRNKGII